MTPGFLCFQVSLYEMTSVPRGLCLIINNEIFDKLSERTGSNKDAGMSTFYHQKHLKSHFSITASDQLALLLIRLIIMM